ncbi:hypothetical protein [Nocardia sp. NPDC005978]|uniref:hypothetical protein n=1 Tax=unclassified Nocardia TaxID=2637762 RepID=UPI0033B6A3EB
MLDIGSPIDIAAAAERFLAAISTATDTVISTAERLTPDHTTGSSLDSRIVHDLALLRAALLDAAQQLRESTYSVTRTAEDMAAELAWADHDCAHAVGNAGR